MIADSLANLMRPRATLENPSVSLQDPDAWDEIFDIGGKSDAGIAVTHEGALKLAPVWQAVSLISGDVAGLPLNVYRRLDDWDREIDWKHPAQFLINDQPNEEMSAFTFWRRLMVHALLWSNGYAYIDRPGRVGEPRGIINLLPDRTTTHRTDSGRLFYMTEVDGQLVPLMREEVIHVQGLSLENGKGRDLVDAARNSWGLALAAEGFNSKFFANGAQAGGLLEIPIGASDKYAENLEKGLSEKYTGKSNWFKAMVLRDGAKFHQTMVDAEKSQMHEVREDQVRDVARFFNLPPAKLGLSDSVSYNSTEQMQIIYLSSCLRHWLSAITGEVRIKLLTDPQRRQRTHFVEHNVSKLIEADSKTMNEVLAIQRQNEIISANEWRRKLNYPRRTDPGGDEYANPNTKSNAGTAADPSSGVSPATATAMRNLLADSIARMARRVSTDAKRAAKDVGRFDEWLNDVARKHQTVFDEAVSPAINAIGMIYHVDRASCAIALQAVRTAFFDAVLRRFAGCRGTIGGDPALLDGACEEFEITIAGELIPLAIPEQNHEDQHERAGEAA